MIEYRRSIVDECGEVRYWCKDMSNEEIYDILKSHPEWKKDCIEVG